MEMRWKCDGNAVKERRKFVFIRRKCSRCRMKMTMGRAYKSNFIYITRDLPLPGALEALYDGHDGSMYSGVRTYLHSYSTSIARASGLSRSGKKIGSGGENNHGRCHFIHVCNTARNNI